MSPNKVRSGHLLIHFTFFLHLRRALSREILLCINAAWNDVLVETFINSIFIMVMATVSIYQQNGVKFNKNFIYI